MSFERHLLPVLFIAAPPPAFVSAAEIEIVYKAGQEELAENERDELQDTFDKLALLLRGGFLAQGPGDARIEVRLTAPRRLLITYQGSPRHSGLLVAFLRLIYSHHQTPEGAFAMLVEALGSEEAAREVYAGVNFPEVIEAIGLSASGEGLAEFDPRHCNLTLVVPGLPAEGIIDAHEIRLAGAAAAAAIDDDAWLSLAGLGAFHPDARHAVYTPGEEEYFASGSDLLIREISVEAPFLAAYLAILVTPLPTATLSA